MKDEYGGNIIDEFIGLKSKMYSIKKIDGSESSTAKGVNIATEFNEFKECKLRNIKQELMKLIKYLDHVLMIKDLCQMMGFTLQPFFTKIVIKNVIRMKMKMIIIIMIMIIKNDIDNDNKK